MVEWANTIFNLLSTHWKQGLIGGGIIVAVVIFLMGVFKTSVVNRIPNKMVRKSVLSFSSVLLVAPVTFVYLIIKSWSTEHFWVMYTVNSIATIIVYWLYEGTHTRELLEIIGKKTILRFCSSVKQGASVQQALILAVEQTESEIKVEHSYKDDDLKKL